MYHDLWLFTLSLQNAFFPFRDILLGFPGSCLQFRYSFHSTRHRAVYQEQHCGNVSRRQCSAQGMLHRQSCHPLDVKSRALSSLSGGGDTWSLFPRRSGEMSCSIFVNQSQLLKQREHYNITEIICWVQMGCFVFCSDGETIWDSILMLILQTGPFLCFGNMCC